MSYDPASAELPHDVRGYGLPIMCAILGVITLAVVGARVWLRAVVQRLFDASDWIILISLFFTLSLLIGASLADKVWLYDHHTYDIPPEKTPTVYKLFMVGNTIWLLGSYFVKLSILLFYRRLVDRSNRVFIRTVWAVIALNLCTTVMGLIVLYTTCTPFNAFWWRLDPAWVATHQFHCIDEGGYVISISALSVCLDLLINFLPTPVLWKMKLPRRQKIALWALFGVGTIASVGAVMRIYYSALAFFIRDDFVWYAYYIWLWTCIELPLGVICASAPALRTLFRDFFHAESPRGSTAFPKSRIPKAQSLTPPTSTKSADQLSRMKPSWLWTKLLSFTTRKSLLLASTNLNHNEPSPTLPMHQTDGPTEADLIRDIRARVAANTGWGPYSTGCPHVPSSVVYEELMKTEDGIWDLGEEEKMGRMLRVVEVGWKDGGEYGKEGL